MTSAPFEWPSSPGLATSSLGRRARAPAARLQRAPAVAVTADDRAADAGLRAILAPHAAQRAGPLAGRHARERALDRRLHDRRAGPRRRDQRRDRRRRARTIPARARSRDRIDRRLPGRGIGAKHAAVIATDERRRKPLRPRVDADDDLLAALDPRHPRRHRSDELLLAVAILDRALNAAGGRDLRELGARTGAQRLDLRGRSPDCPRTSRTVLQKSKSVSYAAPAAAAATTADPTGAAS